ncbi:MAG: RNA methyltransferase [Vicinamibacterales bacterium]
MEQISSRQNATVKRFRALARSCGRDRDEVLLDGAHLLREGLSSGLRIDTVAFAETAAQGSLAPLVSRAQRAGCRVAIVADAIFGALSPVRRPTGAVAIAHLPGAGIDVLLARAPQLLVAIDGVQDPGNVGAIIRAAEASGATGVIVGSASADPFGWKALRGAMGSTFRLPVMPNATLTESLDAARAIGVRVFAATPRDGTRLVQCDLRSPAAILVGGEGAGIPEELLRRADERLTIPMQPPVESLNVAIAAALILYEASRQRSDVAL